jgi:F-type H+-transporting ATPase subunit epsilon
MQLEVITPDKMLFSGEAKLVQLPGESGLFEILDNHAPIISSLQKGVVKVIDINNEKQLFEITGGVVECKSNNVIVLANNGTSLSIKKG